MTTLPFATDWGTVGLGFLGVIVGGLMTFLGTVFTQRETKKREREAAARERRATIRILLASLEELRDFLAVLANDRVWQAPGSTDWVTTWQDRATSFAASGKGEEFESVARAFLVARLLMWQGPQKGEEFTDTDPELIQGWRRAVDSGIVTLEILNAGANNS
jgi:hypothetical protein